MLGVEVRPMVGVEVRLVFGASITLGVWCLNYAWCLVLELHVVLSHLRNAIISIKTSLERHPCYAQLPLRQDDFLLR